MTEIYLLYIMYFVAIFYEYSCSRSWLAVVVAVAVLLFIYFLVEFGFVVFAVEAIGRIGLSVAYIQSVHLFIYFGVLHDYLIDAYLLIYVFNLFNLTYYFI